MSILLTSLVVAKICKTPLTIRAPTPAISARLISLTNDASVIPVVTTVLGVPPLVPNDSDAPDGVGH